MLRISTAAALLSLVLWAAACGEKGSKGQAADSMDSQHAAEAGALSRDEAGSPDCGPHPAGVGSCNECECTNAGWACTLAACDAGVHLDADGSGPDAADIALVGSDVQEKGNCCASDAECTSAMACIMTPGEEQGTCSPKPNKPFCYFDSHCPVLHTCEGAALCACGDDCDPERGTCKPYGGACCAVDADCGQGAACYWNEPHDASICLPVPTAWYECWVDADCEPDEQCVDEYWAPCPYMMTGPFEFGYCQKSKFLECVAKHSGCDCDQGCADGYSVTVYHPADAGEFPPATTPPQELMDVAVAKYECGVCSCTESWAVKDAGVWMTEELGNDAENFCAFLLAFDEACGGCLVAWEGGCC